VYHIDAALTHTEVVEIPRASGIGAGKRLDFGLDEEAVFERVSAGDIDLVMLTSPNNPTGDCLTRSFVERLLAATDAVVLIDHAYIEFARPEYDVTSLLAEHANLALLRTFSKAYGLAGMRIGCLASSEQITRELCKVRQPYSVDALAALAALAALEDEDEAQARVRSIIAERERLAAELGPQGLGLPVAPSEANYLLFRVPEAHKVWQRLLEDHGILVRDLSSSPGLEDCLRVSIGTPAENDELIRALRFISLPKQPSKELSPMNTAARTAHIERQTNETSIVLTLGLDGSGTHEVSTGVPFFDHMLDAMGRHGLFDLRVEATGDLEVDAHHTVEDVGIVMGKAFSEALGEKRGITRFGQALIPMDEALVLAAVDISGRGQLHWEVELPIEFIGSFDTTLAKEFFVALASNAGLTLHVRKMAGENAHHIIEAAAKAVARALAEAVAIDPRVGGNVPSTKGGLA
jgi:imidazoleglycerol-phosphate dehydratase